ncbi:MAG: NUDIX hydrolase [Spirochaetes bacterium]|nr:MAG: NUDIX hydrolase [Spirochaetota bacterium]
MTSMRETNLVYQGSEHPIHGTWLSVDVVAITDDAKIVLIERSGDPHRGELTLPGGLLAAWNGETVDEAARRILREKAGVECGDVAVVDVVSDPSRDERGHTVSIVVATRVHGTPSSAAHPEDIPETMPFGHTAMVRNALRVLAQRMLTDTATTYALLGTETSSVEVIWLFRALDPSLTATAVRSRLDRCGLYTRTDTPASRSPRGRPPSLYRKA